MIEIIIIVMYSLLVLVILFPFMIAFKINKIDLITTNYEKKKSLESQKEIYLNVIHDLKIELDQNKITSKEFEELTDETVVQLEDIERNLTNIEVINTEEFKNVCFNCSKEIQIQNANYCPNCGIKL